MNPYNRRKKIQIQNTKTKKIYLVDEEDAEEFIEEYERPDLLIVLQPKNIYT
jgi:hypothetical protein